MGRYHSGNTVVTLVAGADSITVGPGEGNLTYGDVNASNKDVIVKHDRGTLDGWVETIDKVQEWSITIDLRNESQTSASLARIQDFILKRNKYSGATSESSDTWAFKVVITMDDGVTTAVTTLPECPGMYAFAEAVEGHTLAISGQNAGVITQT